jgi:hypothetical protein
VLGSWAVAAAASSLHPQAGSTEPAYHRVHFGWSPTWRWWPTLVSTGGYLIFKGQLYTVGGTSWSAPTWAGICARINQVRYNTATPPLGLLGPKTYPLLGSSSFRDITPGSNGPNGVYNAGPGFDCAQGSVYRKLITSS